MKDENRTKQQLMNELVELRHRVAELEASGAERKRAEEKLRKAEEDWRDSFNSLEDIMLLIDKDYNVENMNDIGLALLGKSSEEVIGKKCYQVISGGDSAPADCPCRQSLKTKRTESVDRYEERLSKYYSIKSSPIFDENGEIMKFVDLRRDITERKRTEEALQESEAKYRSLTNDVLDSSAVGIFILDAEFKIVWVNRALEGYFGIRRENIIGIDKRSLIRDRIKYIFQDSEGFAQTVLAIYDNNTYVENFECHVLPDGRRKERWLEHWSQPIRSGLYTGGRIEHYTDITERKRAEQELIPLSNAVRMSTDSIVISDLEANILQVNEATLKMYGTDDKRDLIGKNSFALIAPEDQEKAFACIEEVRERGYTQGREYHIVTKDGSKIPVEMSTAIMKDLDGKVVGFVGVSRDITERKRAEADRKRLEQKAQLASRLAAVGEMASGIAHEINNPLTSVIGFAQLLMQEDIPDDFKEYAKVINDGAERVANIIKRLLTFARQQKPERRYVNVNDIIRTTLELRAYEMETSNIKATTRLDPDLPGTMADAGQLQQVFLNIIMNAEQEIRLAHGKGKLLVKTEAVDNTIRISFEDDGRGIAEENLQRIFDPFFTTREAGEGTGLGLSICHGIIAEHDGQLYAKSKSGKGATFVVELPIIREEKQLELADPAIDEPEIVRGKILVVDDEPSTSQLLSQILTDEGHKVQTVDNASAALERIGRERYSLVLLDIKLPGMSGMELYKSMQKIAQSLGRRVVFMTADVLGADTKDFLSKTKAPYITKPFDIEQLKRNINRILTHRA